MAITNESITTSTTAVALNTASRDWMTIRVTAVTTVLSVGGSGVTVATGAAVAVDASAEFRIPPGDVLYGAATAAGKALVTRIAG